MSDSQPYTVQVVVDCADPHPLADWWAEALGWQVEPQDEEFIRSMVDQGFATDDDTTTTTASSSGAPVPRSTTPRAPTARRGSCSSRSPSPRP